MYTTNSVEQNQLILNDCKARVVVVENKTQLDKIIKCKENGCEITKIVQYKGEPEDTHGGLVITVRDNIID